MVLRNFAIEVTKRFLQEARRLLRPGGQLVLTDCIPVERLAPALGLAHALGGPYMKQVSGPVDMRCSLAGYRTMGTAVGLSLASVDDVIPAVLPTFPVLRRMFAPGSPSAAFFRAGVWGLEAAVRLGLLRYCILTFRKLEA